ncbi:MAG: MipA/OmpV family protein [Deltaproteobacteria bacterium]|jgi:outer membrane scaffolding protein for murein synthesis (MipA/OmpV family)|nr:MAG: MipA/OmpV family protein [Deltaproteobacteria bacterium]
MYIYRVVAAVLALLGFLLPQSAICEEKPLWELGVGSALLQMPDYRGSDENRFLLLPYPYLVYRGDILKVERESISGRIFKTDRLLLEVSFFGNVPVDSSKNTARSGMRDMDPTFEIGPSLNITLLENRQDRYKLNLAFPLRAVFSTDFSSLRHEGWVFSPRLTFEKTDLIPESGLNLGISAGPMFADSAYHRYFYSVEPVYATATRPSYDTCSGYSGSTLTIGLNKGFRQLIFNAFVSVDFLRGTVIEDSPLVKTKYSVMSGFTVSWIFLKSAKLVPAGR